MNIGIDGHFLTKKVHQGTATYTRNLIENLSLIDQKNQYYILTDGEINGALHVGDNFHIINELESNSILNVFWKYRFLIKKYSLDIIHLNYYSIPLLPKSCRCVTTIHDILYLTHAEYFPKKFSLLTGIFNKLFLKNSSIITVSNYTKNQLVKHYELDATRIHAIYEGVNHQISPVEDNSESRKKLADKFSVNRKYILYVGRFAPIKNIERVIQAYLSLNLSDHDLVLVGKFDSAFPNKELHKVISEKKNNLIWLSSVDNDDLGLLYSLSEAFCFPSLGEGFGLPILEAMNCKTPVITSNTTACNEVGGEAAVKVNPNRYEEIADAMKMLITDESKRLDHIKRGVEWENTFSWKECAVQTLKVYEEGV